MTNENDERPDREPHELECTCPIGERDPHCPEHSRLDQEHAE